MHEFLDVIETERLILRVPHIEEAAELNAAVCETFEDLNTTVEWAKVKPTVDTTRSVIEFIHKLVPTGKDYPYYAYLKGTGDFVVGSHLFANDLAVPKFEIGYWCRKRFQGCGYVTESTNALVKFAFETLQVNRLQINCDILNERSVRVAERCGFRLEAKIANDKRTPLGDLRTTAVFVMLPEDYTAHCQRSLR